MLSHWTSLQTRTIVHFHGCCRTFSIELRSILRDAGTVSAPRPACLNFACVPYLCFLLAPHPPSESVSAIDTDFHSFIPFVPSQIFPRISDIRAFGPRPDAPAFSKGLNGLAASKSMTATSWRESSIVLCPGDLTTSRAGDNSRSIKRPVLEKFVCCCCCPDCLSTNSIRGVRAHNQTFVMMLPRVTCPRSTSPNRPVVNPMAGTKEEKRNEFRPVLNKQEQVV